MRLLLGAAIGVFAVLLAASAFAMPIATGASSIKSSYSHAMQLACGNGTKCCWTECRAGEGCIQHCDSGR